MFDLLNFISLMKNIILIFQTLNLTKRLVESGEFCPYDRNLKYRIPFSYHNMIMITTENDKMLKHL